MADLQIQRLKPVLDQLYADFNHPDSATDPIHIVRRFQRDDDREVVGVHRRRAGVRARVERAAVDRAGAGGDGSRAGRLRTAFRSPARRAGLRRHRPSLDARNRHRRAAVAAAADDRSRRIGRGVLSRRLRRRRRRHRRGARQLLDAGDGARSESRVRPGPEAAGRLLLLSASVGRVGLQAAEPVSALDGPPRRARSRRVEARVAGEADRAARHARDSRRPLPAPDRATPARDGAWRATSRRRCGSSIRPIR